MFGSPQNVWPLNELYIRSGANAGQLMDFSGANDLCCDFVNNRYVKALVPIQNPIASAHPTDILALNASGTYNPSFAADEVVRNNLGLQVVPTATNLFLNSGTVATQTVTVLNATEYTISVVGAGSIVLTGAGTGIVTAGSPVTLTTGTTSLTCTLTGSLTYAQVETGAFATPPIVTTGTSATRPGNQDIISNLTMATGVEFCMIADVIDLGADYVRAVVLSDGGGANYTRLFASSGKMQSDTFNGGIAQAQFYLGTWPFGIAGMVSSVTTDFVKSQMVGVSAVADTSVIYPTMTKVNFGGRGFDVTKNAYLRIKEFYMRTNFTPDAASFAEMLALATARKAVYT